MKIYILQLHLLVFANLVLVGLSNLEVMTKTHYSLTKKRFVLRKR